MILKLLNGIFTPNFKSIDDALYVQMETTIFFTAKNNANILSETYGLFKSEVDMLGDTKHLNRGYGSASSNRKKCCISN